MGYRISESTALRYRNRELWAKRVRIAVSRFGRDRARAAQALDVSLRTLGNWIRELELPTYPPGPQSKKSDRAA